MRLGIVFLAIIAGLIATNAHGRAFGYHTPDGVYLTTDSASASFEIKSAGDAIEITFHDKLNDKTVNIACPNDSKFLDAQKIPTGVKAKTAADLHHYKIEMGKFVLLQRFIKILNNTDLIKWDTVDLTLVPALEGLVGCKQ